MLRGRLKTLACEMTSVSFVAALVALSPWTASAAPFAQAPAEAQAPGGNHGGIYADWEYPDFAWSDEEADALADWVPAPLNRQEAVDWIDWALAEEQVDERTATTATYILWDRQWRITRAWPARSTSLGSQGSGSQSTPHSARPMLPTMAGASRTTRRRYVCPTCWAKAPSKRTSLASQNL